jgi:hypothetical protein
MAVVIGTQVTQHKGKKSKKSRRHCHDSRLPLERLKKVEDLKAVLLQFESSSTGTLIMPWDDDLKSVGSLKGVFLTSIDSELKYADLEKGSDLVSILDTEEGCTFNFRLRMAWDHVNDEQSRFLLNIKVGNMGIFKDAVLPFNANRTVSQFFAEDLYQVPGNVVVGRCSGFDTVV